MKLLKVDTVEQAREKIISYTKAWKLKAETLPLGETQGRVAAEDVFAYCDVPSFRRSAVDGYAVIASDTAGAGESIPVFLKRTGTVSMGKTADLSIKPGECAYVPTGGMLPDGADAAVMIEYCEELSMNNEKSGINNEELINNKKNKNGIGDLISICEAVASGAGVVLAGEDFINGDLLLKKGARVRPQEIGVLSAAGITEIKVLSPLIVGIISTGDELVAPEKKTALGEVRDINTNTLKALAEKYGFITQSAQVLPDDEIIIEKKIKELVPLCDIIVISGGSSQGEKDFTEKIIENTADPGVFTHGLALKPGKPTILGWDEETKTLFAGLPGHPVSAMMVFEILFGHLVKTGNLEFGIRNEETKLRFEGIYNLFSFNTVSAIISHNVPGADGRAVCVPVALSYENNIIFAQPVFGKAGLISLLTRADGYIIIDANKEGINKDENVIVHLF